MKKEFKVRKNLAIMIFLIAYTIYIGAAIYFGIGSSDLLLIVGFGVFVYVFFLGFRPYKYTVEKKYVTIHYRLWRSRTVDLMVCETICDPISRWADIATRPHAIEIYTNANKRYCFFPIERIEFVTSIIQANKRMHCTVKEYSDIHRKIEKKLRKERIRNSKREAIGQDKKES